MGQASMKTRLAKLGTTAIAVSTVLCLSTMAQAASLDLYSVIALGDQDDTFTLSNSEIGAIGVNGSTSPPGSLPPLPAGTSTPTVGVSLGGNVAITNPNGTLTFSNSDIHSANTGLGNQGVECSGSFNACTDNGSQISSSNRFNSSTPGASFSNIGEGNGIVGNVDNSSLLSELTTQNSDFLALSATQTFNISTIDTDRLDVFASGLNIVDINTNNNDLLLQNSTWTISGQSDTSVIFRLTNPGSILDISEARIGLAGDIGRNNVLFLVNGDQGEESFNFNNVEFDGISFWDVNGRANDNLANFNNVRGCGQVVTDKVNFQNVSLSNCAFSLPPEIPDQPSIVPLPAGGVLLLSSLLGLGIARRYFSA